MRTRQERRLDAAPRQRGNIRRRVAALVATLLVSVGLTVATASPAHASFTWAANSWGACNTSKPYYLGYSPIYFQYVSRPSGRPGNYYYASCFYWGYNGRWWVPIYTGINWNYACAIDGARYVQYRWSDYTVWCVG